MGNFISVILGIIAPVLTLEPLHDVLHEGGDLQRPRLELQAPRLDARGIKQIAHETLQAAGASANILRRLPLHFALLSPAEEVGVARDDANGHAELVGDERDELLAQLLELERRDVLPQDDRARHLPPSIPDRRGVGEQ